MFDADMLVDTGHSHAALCEGFHEDEETHRWTDGVARIPNRWISNFAGAFTLELLLFPTRSRYRVAAAAGGGRRGCRLRCPAAEKTSGPAPQARLTTTKFIWPV